MLGLGPSGQCFMLFLSQDRVGLNDSWRSTSERSRLCNKGCPGTPVRVSTCSVWCWPSLKSLTPFSASSLPPPAAQRRPSSAGGDQYSYSALDSWRPCLPSVSSWWRQPSGGSRPLLRVTHGPAWPGRRSSLGPSWLTPQEHFLQLARRHPAGYVSLRRQMLPGDGRTHCPLCNANNEHVGGKTSNISIIK
jgi:hypothetical protein